MSIRGSSSSSSKITSSAADDKTLLKFYQRKFEEFHRKEDKYKEKVDRHLKNLITDRHELEEEVLRRGEKISDLQKALVELQLNIFEERSRFLKLSSENEELKRKEEQLHGNIRQLLAMTQQQDLRDRIIYILKNPKVEVGYQSEFPIKSESKDVLSANKKLKDELDELKHQLDEVLSVSKNQSNVVLEDCKQALEKSKMKILQGEVQIKELHKKLQNLQAPEKRSLSATEANEKHSYSTLKEDNINLKHSLSQNKKMWENIRHSSSDQQENTKHSLLNTKNQDEYKKCSLSNAKGQQRNMKPSLSDSTEQEQSKIGSLSNTKEHKEDKKYSSSTRSISSEGNLANLVVSESLANICSKMREMHLSLIFFQKLISKVDNILNTIHATKLYQRLAKIPKAPAFMEIHVELNTIAQLESTIRQCTRLTYEVNDKNQTLCKNFFSGKKTIQDVTDLSSELKHFDGLLKEMTVLTADNDLLNLELKRSDFFHALRDSSVAIPEEDRLRCLSSFKKIVVNNAALKKMASRAVDFVESIVNKYSARKTDPLLDAFSSHSLERNISKERIIKSDSALLSKKEAKSQSIKDLESLHKIYKRTIEEAKSLGFDQSPEGKSMNEKLQATEQQLHEEKLKKCDDNFDDYIMKTDYLDVGTSTSDYDDILRKIDKTLIKVRSMEEGKFSRDEKPCRKLAEKVEGLTTKFKELVEEFSVKTFQDQFSEYSRVTLSKLEDLANQCKSSVEAAEAQIAAHRSNAKQLSGKLRETEDLLRESINECLSLKKMVKFSEEQHEMEKYSLVSQLRERLENLSERAEIQGILEDVVSYIDVRKDTAADPFVCVFCKDGMGHAACKEKIQELTAEERKSRTELKLLMREAKEEKENLRYHREIAEHNVTQLNKRNEELRQKIRTLESKDGSLSEQLKMLRSRLRRMEQFRLLEVEGFQTDIKNLKAKIQEMEKNLRKAVVMFENDRQDMELLGVVHETAHRSKQAAMALGRLKAKLYELENNLKSL